MSIFDGRRISAKDFGLDIQGLRRGLYSDKYFLNTAELLHRLMDERYQQEGFLPDSKRRYALKVGSVKVEAQVFNRRSPFAVVAGVDHALSQLRHAAGHLAYHDPIDRTLSYWAPHHHELEVKAVHDGTVTQYNDNPLDVQPVLRILGPYRYFAHLETTILGVLSRASRIATNVYLSHRAAKGKTILYFPARFDMPEVQAIDGYAYWIGGKRHELDTGAHFDPNVSTDYQASIWGGKGMGTIAHSTIASFMGDSCEAMFNFARVMPLETPRVLLADYSNNSIDTILRVIKKYWGKYSLAISGDNGAEMKRWSLHGVRLDTSSELTDIGLPAGAEPGVTPQLVFAVRYAIDNAWKEFSLRDENKPLAQEFCERVKIIVTGGFTPEKIALFERMGAPVDVYGVGSSLLSNDSASNCDYTMDIVKVNVGSKWVDIAKVGRRACDNNDLEPVSLYETANQ